MLVLALSLVFSSDDVSVWKMAIWQLFDLSSVLKMNSLYSVFFKAVFTIPDPLDSAIHKEKKYYRLKLRDLESRQDPEIY